MFDIFPIWLDADEGGDGGDGGDAAPDTSSSTEDTGAEVPETSDVALAPVSASPPSALPASGSAEEPSTAPEDVPPPSESPVVAVEASAPWGADQFSTWDGSKDSLSPDLHNYYDHQAQEKATWDALKLQQEQAIAQLETQFSEFNFGEEDPRVQAGKDAAAQAVIDHQATKDEVTRLQGVIDENTAAAAEKQNAESDAAMTLFNANHDWVSEVFIAEEKAGSQAEPNSLVSVFKTLIGQGHSPNEAGNLMKGKSETFLTAFKQAVAAGVPANYATQIAATAEVAAAPKKYSAPPAPKAGNSFVNGAGKGRQSGARSVTSHETHGAKELMSLMGEQLAAKMTR